MTKVLLSSILLASSALALGACAAPTDVSSDEPAAEQSADAISTTSVNPRQWDHQPAANLECDATVKGAFSARSSRHYFSFPGTARQQTTFTLDLDANVPPYLGAAIIVTDNNYKVIGGASTRSGRSARVEVTFPSDGKYFVFAAPNHPSLVWGRTGYALTAGCKPIKVSCDSTAECAPGEQCLGSRQCSGGRCIGLSTCQARPLCVQLGTPDGRTVAKNFPAGSYAAADTYAQATAAGNGYGISLATCEEVAAGQACTEQYQPVCSVSLDGAHTEGNACFFRLSALAKAGATGEAIVKSVPGECGDSAPTCATYYVLPPNAASPVYYVSNWGTAAQAQAFLSLTNGEQKAVLSGACNKPRGCTKEGFPLCGTIRSETPGTYGNKCMFESAIRNDAGAIGASKGFYTVGACQ